MKKINEHKILFLSYQILCIFFMILGLLFVILARFNLIFGYNLSINLLGFGLLLIILSFISYYLVYELEKNGKISRVNLSN